MRTGCIHYSATMVNKLTYLNPKVYISNNEFGLFPSDSIKVPTYSGPITAIFSSFLAIFLLFFFTLFQKLKFGKPVFYFPSFHPWNYLLISYAKWFNIKTIQTIHDSFTHPGEEVLMRDTLKHWSIRKADQLIFLSKNELFKANKITDTIERKSIVIPHPLLLWPGLSENKLPYSAKPKLLMLGRINYYKGLDLLIEAIEPIIDQFESVTIAGKIGGRVSKKEVSNLVYLDKYLSELEISELLSTHHILILPYREASQSGVIPLAVSANIPMVITKQKGLKEQLSEKAAVWVEPNPSSIQDGIIHLKDSLNYKEVKMELSAFKKSFEKEWEEGFLKSLEWLGI